MIEKIKNYIFPLLLLISIGIFKNVILYALFWIAMTVFLIAVSGLPKDNNYLKSSIIRISVISILMYFILTYMFGLVLGFNENLYNLSFLGILKNIAGPFIVIVSQELIRFIYAKKCVYDLKPYILLTIIYIVLNILIEINNYTFNGSESIFLFMCMVVVSNIAFQLLYSYITIKVSLIPSLIIRLIFDLYIFVLPIFPSLGNYMFSIVSLLYPFITFVCIQKNIDLRAKKKKEVVKKAGLGTVITFACLFIIIILVSGLFSYQVVAIGSGSMEPIIYRGDAVLLKKRKDFANMKVGEVLAFKKNNVLITHRIIGIEKKHSQYIFKTKGDNNVDVDNYNVFDEDVVGTVVFKISYVGYPTIWINEQFKKN